jgi:hypothetical protein
LALKPLLKYDFLQTPTVLIVKKTCFSAAFSIAMFLTVSPSTSTASSCKGFQRIKPVALPRAQSHIVRMPAANMRVLLDFIGFLVPSFRF